MTTRDPAVLAAALEADAAHFAWRATQELLAIGPGIYVNLLRSLAAESAARAQRLRAQTGRAA